MELFKRKKEESIKEQNIVNQIPPNSNPSGFKNAIRVEDHNEKVRYLRLKEDLIQGKIEESDLSDEELDAVIELLNEEITQNDLKIKSMQQQIAKYKKNN